MAITLEELVLKLEADNKQFMAQMVAAQGVTADAVASMTDSIKKMSEEGTKDTGFFQDAFATMTGFIGGQAVIGAFNMAKDAAKQLFQTFVVDGVKASMESLDAQNQLQQSMARTGQFVKGAGEAMAEYADRMEATTKFSDDQINTNAALIESMTRLDVDGLKRATSASADLATALNIDLETASRLVGKAAEGNVEAFKRYGVVIEGGVDKNKVFADTLSVIEKRFGGAAEKGAQTFAGSVIVMGNAFENVQKAIGKTIVENVAIVDVMNAVKKIFIEVTDAIEKNEKQIRIFIAEGLLKAVDATTALIAVFDAAARIGKAVWETIKLAITTAMNIAIMEFYAFGTAVAKVLNAVGLKNDAYVKEWQDGFKAATEHTVETAVSGAKEIGNAFTEETKLEMLGTKVAEIGLVAEGGLKKVSDGMIATVEPTNQAKQKIVELSEVMKASIAEGESLAKSYVNQVSTSSGVAQQQVTDAEMVRDARIMAAQEQANAGMGLFQADSVLREQELEANIAFNDEKLAILDQQQKNEAATRQLALENGKITKEQFQIAELASEKKFNDQRKRNAMDMQQLEIMNNKAKIADFKATGDQLAGLQNSQNAYAKSVGKAAAIAMTIMKTAEGAQSAYASLAPIPFVGPALGIAAAAAVIADGTARLAQIRGARTGIDEVPGVGTGDSFGPVMLAPKERVVPGETNQDLKQAIAMILSGNGGGSVQVEISIKDQFVDMIEAKLIERDRLNYSRGA